MDTDYQAHLGFEICKRKRLRLDVFASTVTDILLNKQNGKFAACWLKATAFSQQNKRWWDEKHVYTPSSWSSLTTDTLWLWKEAQHQQHKIKISEIRAEESLCTEMCKSLFIYCVSHRLAIVHKLSWHKIGGMERSWTFLPLVIQIVVEHPKHKTHFLIMVLCCF